MKTAIENDELLTELEELYLVSKHWISDLDFLAQDLGFFRKLFGINSAMLVRGGEFETITNAMISIAQSNKEHEDLKKEVIGFLQKLGDLILDAHQPIEIGILDTHAELQSRLQKAVENLRVIKATVLALSKATK